MTVVGEVDRTPGFERTGLTRMIDLHNQEWYELRGDELIHIDTPTDSALMCTGSG